MTTIPLSIRVPCDQLRRLDEASHHHQMSRAEFVRLWLDKAVQQWHLVDRHNIADRLRAG